MASISTRSISFRVGQPDVRIQALAAGQIDATTVSIGVWLSLPDKTGLHVLVDQDAYYAAAPVVNKVNIVSQKALEERHDDVVTVITRADQDFARLRRRSEQMGRCHGAAAAQYQPRRPSNPGRSPSPRAGASMAA